MGIALAALLPVFLILYYVYIKDIDPEPKKTVAITFALGAASTIVAIVLELVVTYFINMFFIPNTDLYYRVDTFFGVAVVEEMCKWSVIMLYIWNHKDFDDSYDAIVYCVTASLGFAAFENILYVFQHGFTVAIARALTSIPGHAAFAVFMGYFVAKAKINCHDNNYKKMGWALFLSVLVPCLVHAEYDYLIFAEKFMMFYILIALIDIIAFLMIRHGFKNDAPMNKKALIPPDFKITPPPFQPNLEIENSIKSENEEVNNNDNLDV